MPSYRFARGTVSSAIALPELDPPDTQAADVTITRGHVVRPAAWDRTFTTRDGFITHHLGRSGTEFVLGFADDLTCRIDEALERVVVDSPRDDRSLARPIVHQVLPLVFAQRGATIIHASTVAIGDEAITLFGPSKAGKSTLAAALVRRGAALVGDDALWLSRDHDDHKCQGTYRGVWLAPASCAALGIAHPPPAGDDKVLALRDSNITTPLRLCACVWLFDSDDEDDTAIELDPMSAAQVYFALYDHLFQLDPSDRRGARRVFHHVTEAADDIPGWRLKAPYEFEHLDAACDLIFSLARQIHGEERSR